MGQQERQALQLALEAAERQDKGGPARTIAVLHGDLGSGRDVAPTAVRLITLNKVAALLGGIRPSETEPLAGVALSYERPLIALGGSLPEQRNPYAFQIGLSASRQAEALARAAREKLHVRQVAVVINNRESAPGLESRFSSMLGGAFAAQFRKLGGTVLAEQVYKNPTELAELSERAGRLKADAIVVAGVPDDVNLVAATKSQRQTPILFAGSELTGKPFQGEAGDRTVYSVTAFVATEVSDEGKEFVQQYEKHRGEMPNTYAALSYDGGRALFQAIRQAHTLDGSGVRDALLSTSQLRGVTGSITWNEDHSAERPAFIVQWQHGKMSVIDRQEPAGGKVAARRWSSLAGREVMGYAAEGGMAPEALAFHLLCCWRPAGAH